MSNPKLHYKSKFGSGPLIPTFAKVPAATGCECWNRTTTGDQEFPGKPVALIDTSPRATHALAALTITLETMSAQLIKDASITLPLLGTANDAESIATDPELAGPLRGALENFVGAIAALSA
jgi:hypothetical protein